MQFMGRKGAGNSDRRRKFEFELFAADLVCNLVILLVAPRVLVRKAAV